MIFFTRTFGMTAISSYALFLIVLYLVVSRGGPDATRTAAQLHNSSDSRAPASEADPRGLLWTPLSHYESSCADECRGKEEIVSALKEGKLTPPCCMDLLRETTEYVDHVLTRNSITYWTMKGTALGVERHQGVIPHDYDIDVGILHQDINKVAAVREQIWADGYVLLQAPFKMYVNYNFIIAKRTRLVQGMLDELHLGSSDQVPLTGSLKPALVSAELMLFKEVNGMLLQLVCTAPHPRDPNAYEGTVSPDLWTVYDADRKSFAKREKSAKRGWMQSSTWRDKSFLNWREKLADHYTSPYCERTAPVSFKYDAPAKWVLPVVRAPFFSTTICVPSHTQAFLANYFGKDYMTPKARFAQRVASG
jgi:phosphorylcholine metabolism protein LicD